MKIMNDYFAESHLDFLFDEQYKDHDEYIICELNYKLYRHLPNVNDYLVDFIDGQFIVWVDNVKHIDLFPLHWESHFNNEFKNTSITYKLLKNRNKFIKNLK